MNRKPLLIYALCGSQRQASTNRALLVACAAAAPDEMSIEISDLIGDLPIFTRTSKVTTRQVSSNGSRRRSALPTG